MITFTIDETNDITAHAGPSDAGAVSSAECFSNSAELAQLAGDWPGDRLIEIWNSLPGATPVKKFKDRKTAIGRIWKAIGNLCVPAAAGEATVEHQRPQGASSGGKLARKATRAKEAPKGHQKATSARGGSKKAAVLALLARDNGASLADLMNATGWQAHSVRGFLSGVLRRKMGLMIESAKQEDGDRVYSLSR